MILTNFHCHSNFSDGKDSLETIIEKAIELNIKKLGITDHSPVEIKSECNMKKSDFKKYVDEINILKERYKSNIEIWTGLELEWLEDLTPENYHKIFPVDFYIGSIHFIKINNQYIPFDLSEKMQEDMVKKIFDGSYQNFAKKYYQDVIKMANISKIDFIGHLDHIKKFNRGNKYFDNDDSEILKYVATCLDVIADRNIGVEVNVGGITRGRIDDTYPSLTILKMCRKKNIKIILNSDSHNADKLITNLDVGLKIIREAGYTENPSKIGLPYIYK